MARIRSIKPEFPQSESMGRVSRDARLCFIMLWTIADDAGRLRGNSRMLASLLYPYDDDAKRLMDKWLAELEAERCVTRYTVNGDSYVQVNGWAAHQKIDRPSPSKIPAPIEASRVVANPREPSPLDQGGDQGKDQGDSAEVEASPPAFTLPLVDKTEFPISQATADEWKAAYPAVDVAQQLREMRTWCLANPSKRKTARGVSAFIVRWLGSEQDKGGKPMQQGFASNVGVTVPMKPDALFKPEPALTPEQLAANRANAAEALARLKRGGMAAIRQPTEVH